MVSTASRELSGGWLAVISITFSIYFGRSSSLPGSSIALLLSESLLADNSRSVSVDRLNLPIHLHLSIGSLARF